MHFSFRYLVNLLICLSTPTFAVELLSPGTVRRFRWHFAGKHALVTGGSSGIGAALSEQLVQLGASVLLLGRDPAKLQAHLQTLKPLKTKGTQQLEMLAVDVTDRDAWRAGFELFSADGFQFDIVINNAGMSYPALTDELIDVVLDQLLDTNLRAPIDITRYFFGRFQGRGTGMLGFVASLAGSINIAGYSAYGATKAGLVAFADTVRHELSATKVAVSVILPPDVATPTLEKENLIKPAVTKHLS